MAEEQTTTQRTDTTASPYRIDVKLHEILMEPSGETQAKETPQPESPGLKLPAPVYPQRTYSETEPTLKEYQRSNALRTWHAWGKPYFASRSLKNRKELRPIIALNRPGFSGDCFS